MKSLETLKRKQYQKFFSYLTLLSSLLFLMNNCVLYPRYTRPCMEMPEHWRIDNNEMSTAANIRWWQQFDDSVLDQLIEEALECNKDLAIASARIDQFRAQLGIVNSELYPQIFAQANGCRQRISQTIAGSNLFAESDTIPANQNGNNGGVPIPFLPDTSSTSPFSHDYFTAFTASYELDFWGKRRSATYAAYADLLAEVNARRTVILSVVSSVAIAYIQLRQYDSQLKVSLQTLHSRQESLDLAKIRFQEGMTSELEVKQAASEKEEAAIQVVQFQTLIPQQENLLSILLGHPPQAIKRGPSVDDLQLPPEVPKGLPADLLTQRPDIVAAEKRLMASNFRIGQARALFFPDISLTGFYGYESAELHKLCDTPSRTWQWMINLLQPIFTGWLIESQVELAHAVKKEALYHYLQTILNALREVNDALIAHKNSKKYLFIRSKRIKDLKEYLHLAKLQYENGQVDYLNVLDAERQLFAAQLELAQSQADVFLTLVNVYKALGGGWVIDAEIFGGYESQKNNR